MKKHIFVHFGFLWAVLLFAVSPAHSQNMVNELDEKFHLEKSISERLEQTLKTRLEKKYFDITVEAKLRHKPLTVGKKHFDKTADDLQNWYANELNQASRQKDRPFELESLVVTLGLSDEVDLKYQDNLKVWLQNWVQSSFGSKGEAQVIVRPSDVINKPAPVVKQEETPYWKDIGRFQNLLGMLFLGFAFVIGRYLQSRKPNRKVTPEMLNKANELPEADLNEIQQREVIRTLKNKIAWISPGIKRQVDTMIASWSSKESPSYLKVAAYLEALAEGGTSMPEASRAQVPALAPHMHLALAKTLANLAELDTSMLLALYQEIYSELLAGELVEREPRHVDFEFMNDWTENDLHDVFDFLSEACQVALLTRLPQSLRRRYSQIADPVRLRCILSYSLKHNEVTDDELLTELHTWQKRRERNLSAPEFAFKIAKLREAWSVFSRVEETLWMYQVVVTHPEMKETLTRDSMHLAFMGDWSAEVLRKFCSLTKSRELAAAAKQLPFLQEPIFNACGETTRKEIQLEMETMTDQKLSQAWEKFLAAFDSFAAGEQLPTQTASISRVSTTKGVA